MKKDLGKYIGLILAILCLILIITLIILKVSSVNAQSANSDLKEKVSEELKYLDTNITELINKLNNIDVIKYKVYNKEINDSSSKSSTNEQNSSQGSSQEESSQSESTAKESSSKSEGSSQSQNKSLSQNKQSSSNDSESSNNSQEINETMISELVPNTTLDQNNEEIDWKRISFIAENIYSSWPSINLDFKKQGISDEYINNLSVSLDSLIQAIKNKDKENSIINLFNMYINVPKYSSAIKEDENKTNLYTSKLNVINAYTLVSTGDKWEDVKTCITNAKNNLSKIVASEQDEKRKNSLEKTYIILEDLERITDMQDKNIFYMGYKNIIQEFETI